MTLDNFYQSKEWENFRRIVIAERTRDDGLVYDEVTGKPILKRYDMILHHKEPLTEDNVNDANISLNPDNIMIVSHKTHNKIHEKLGYKRKEIYIVYGSPLSGKTTWIKENMSEGDLLIDMDNIWECISGQKRYVKPPRLNAIAFMMRDQLIGAVKHRLGQWQNCYICGGYPLISERERLSKELGARLIYIDSGKEECVSRLESCTDRDKAEWLKYIDTWWERYDIRV